MQYRNAGFLVSVSFLIKFILMKKTLKNICASLLLLLDNIALKPINPSAFTDQRQKASVKFSALMVGLKGKIGGTVFQGSKTGFAAKNKPSGNFVKALKWLFGFPQTQVKWDLDYSTLLEPGYSYLSTDGSNTNAIGNTSAQALISRISKAWGSLTLEQQAAWTAAAPAFQFTNRWGEQYTGSGFQVFMSINNQIMRFSQPIIISPPSSSDGGFADFNWNEIYVAPVASATDVFQVSMPFDTPELVAMSAAGSTRFKGKPGCYKLAFGGKGAVVEAAERTFEMLPSAEMLGVDTRSGGDYMITISIYNLENGHLIYMASYPHKVLPFPNADLFQWVYAGEYDAAPPLALAPVLDWSTDPLIIAYGNITVDHESPQLGHLIRLLQLAPFEAITFTKGGVNPGNFYTGIGLTTISHLSPTVMYANASGTFGNMPLINQFQPDSPGAKSCTITITSPTLIVPIVINFNGTGV